METVAFPDQQRVATDVPKKENCLSRRSTDLGVSFVLPCGTELAVKSAPGTTFLSGKTRIE
jgi:hypothetical protein